MNIPKEEVNNDLETPQVKHLEKQNLNSAANLSLPDNLLNNLESQPLSTENGTGEKSNRPETKVEQIENNQTEQKTEKGAIGGAVKNLSEKLGFTKKKPTQIPQVRDEITIKVENILEEGLKDVFKELSPVERQKFKIQGEETAFKIRDLLKSTHLKVKNIFQLILEWLKMLPGINRFFLEQEAKIKADKIITLKDLNKQQ